MNDERRQPDTDRQVVLEAHDRLTEATPLALVVTEAGEPLQTTLSHLLHGLDAAVAALDKLRHKSWGTIRITTVKHAIKTTFSRPRAGAHSVKFPWQQMEIVNDYGLRMLQYRFWRRLRS